MFKLVRMFLSERGIYFKEDEFLLWMDANRDKLDDFDNTYCLKLDKGDWLVVKTNIMKNDKRESD